MRGFDAGGDSARGDRVGFVGEGRLALSGAEGVSPPLQSETATKRRGSFDFCFG